MFGSRSHRVAEPAQTVDVFTAIFQQRVVDDKIEQAGRIEGHDDLHGHATRQVGDGPGRTAEEIVISVADGHCNKASSKGINANIGDLLVLRVSASDARFDELSNANFSRTLTFS